MLIVFYFVGCVFLLGFFLGFVYVMGYFVLGIYGVVYGQILVIMFLYVMRFNLEVVEDWYVDVGFVFGGGCDVYVVIEVVEKLFVIVGINCSLSDLGVLFVDIDGLMMDVFCDMIILNILCYLFC